MTLYKGTHGSQLTTSSAQILSLLSLLFYSAPINIQKMATRALLVLREASPWALVGAVVSAALLWLAAWTLEWAWWTPRRLDRALRAQGLKGTRYRLFTGDVRENARINREARTKPMPIGSHDIIPRVQPMFYNVVKEYGNHCPPSKLFYFLLQFRDAIIVLIFSVEA